MPSVLRLRSLLASTPSILTSVGVNSVPAAGLLWGNWSASTTMVVYFLECLLLLLLGLTVGRVWWMTDRSATFPEVKVIQKGTGKSLKTYRSRRKFVETFLVVGGGFLGVTGVFIAVMLFLMLRLPFDGAAVMAAMPLIAALHGIGVVYDRLTLGTVDVDVAETWCTQTLGRIFLLYLGVFAGVFAAMWQPVWFLAPFVALKTLVDVGGQVQLVTRLRP